MDKLCTQCGSTQTPPYSEAVLRRLKTNDPPNPQDEAFLRAELQHGQQHIALLLSLELARPSPDSSKLEELRTERKIAQQFVDDHERILAPFRRIGLPPEIMFKIFHYAEPVVTVHTKYGIWRLARVCRYWRSILLTSGSLWSTIQIETKGDRKCHHIVAEIISRSGNAPLKISLLVRGLSSSSSHSSDVTSVITAASDRWSTISLRIPTSHFSLLSKVKGHVPMLTELNFWGATLPDFDWLVEAPLLRKVVIDSKDDDLSPVVIRNIPWSQLRECDVRVEDPATFLHLCTNLEIYHLREYIGTQSGVLCLHKLRKLIFEWGNGTLLNDLILPSLDCVEIRGSLASVNTFTHISDLVSRSSCTLTALTLAFDSFVRDSQIIEVLSNTLLHNLTTFDVTYYKDSRLLSDILTIRPGGSRIILPRLEKLSLHPIYSNAPMLGEDRDTLALVVEMTQSRQRSEDGHIKTSRLAFLEYSVSSTFHRYRPPSDLAGVLAPLLVFRNEGLVLNIDGFYLDDTQE